jgi:hypothetical protein
VAVLVSLMVTIGVASLVYRWVEQPCIALGRRIAGAPRPRAAMA